MAKQRLILVVGAETQAGILEALRELGNDKTLERSGCIGITSSGADFDYTLDTATEISVAALVREIQEGTWGHG